MFVFPPTGPVVYVLDLADRLISKAGPFAAAGIMVGSIYWTAVTYGAVTVMQVPADGRVQLSLTFGTCAVTSLCAGGRP